MADEKNPDAAKQAPPAEGAQATSTQSNTPSQNSNAGTTSSSNPSTPAQDAGPVLGNVHEYHEVEEGVKARSRTAEERSADVQRDS